MSDFKNKIAKIFFNREFDIADPHCITCNSPNVHEEDFRDDLSKKEFLISRMCQICQDNIFGLDE